MTADRPVRIANCSGFYGDRISAARAAVEGGPIDVLTGDWLAELTMLILWKAKARNADVLIVDTAGRLHNKSNLMAELEKMKRIAGREVQGAPHETLLVIDAVTGQNGLEQARQFTKVANVTGLVLTKLDGTAKGGIAVAIAKELNLPIRYVGIGEQVNDLMVFNAEDYVNGLFN